MSNIKIQKSEYQNILRLYNEGMTANQISSIYNVSATAIYSIIQQFSDRRKPKSYKNLSYDEQNHVVQLYLDGKSTVEIGDIYGFNHHAIASLLDDYGIDRRDSSNCHKIYSIKEDYWDNIDTQNKAYFLGFLFADGNNSSSKNTIRLSLKEDDREILEKLRIEIGSNRPLRFRSSEQKRKKDVEYNYKDQYSLDVFNKHWCERLIELGCVPNKSLILQFPDYLDENLISHFIRGYFDGDGCIVNAKKGHCVNLTSTKAFCESIQRIVYDKLCIKSYLRPASNNNGITTVWELRKKDDIKIFLDWIYQDAELYLERKHNLYIQKYC